MWVLKRLKCSEHQSHKFKGPIIGSCTEETLWCVLCEFKTFHVNCLPVHLTILLFCVPWVTYCQYDQVQAVNKDVWTEGFLFKL